MYTDNPIADFHAHDAEQQEQLERLPVCHHCKDPIQQEKAVRIEGRWYCDDCLRELREDTQDWW